MNDHLTSAGIYTALDLTRINPQNIRTKFSVVLERTVRELRGEKCLTVDDIIESKNRLL